ncbi:MAG TPA: putative Ig domain-containing protein [Dermatophilaceae bacterium]|nr:putative Ig domain-containing protein [Dermatophilaceae bacterium]
MSRRLRVTTTSVIAAVGMAVPTVAQAATSPDPRDVAARAARTAQFAFSRPAGAAVSLGIATKIAPGAERTKAYRTMLVGKGGRTPYRYSMAAGTLLPHGLSLDRFGLISGRPTHSGASAFTVAIRDRAGATNTRGLILVVSPRGGFVLTPTRVHTLALPATVATTRATLQPALGPSVSRSGTGCTLADPDMTSQSIAWPGLEMYGEDPVRADIRIRTWVLPDGHPVYKLALPYRVDVGTSLGTLRARVRGVRVEDAGKEYFASRGYMLWVVSKRTSRVTQIVGNPRFCD